MRRSTPFMAGEGGPPRGGSRRKLLPGAAAAPGVRVESEANEEGQERKEDQVGGAAPGGEEGGAQRENAVGHRPGSWVGGGGTGWGVLPGSARAWSRYALKAP